MWESWILFAWNLDKKPNQLSDFQNKTKTVRKHWFMDKEIKILFVNLWQFRAVRKRRKKKYKKLDSFCAFRLETAVWQTTEIWVVRVFTFYRLTFKRLNDMKLQAITHAYVHRLADVHLAGFAPAFTLSFHDSECSRKPPVPIASVVMGQCKKQENRVLRMKSLWRTVRFST